MQVERRFSENHPKGSSGPLPQPHAKVEHRRDTHALQGSTMSVLGRCVGEDAVRYGFWVNRMGNSGR